MSAIVTLFGIVALVACIGLAARTRDRSGLAELMLTMGCLLSVLVAGGGMLVTVAA